jgi:hypothetical protein
MTGPCVEVDVTVEDLGAGSTELRAAVDAAYRAKYARYGRSSLDAMVADAAAASTLRLVPRRSGGLPTAQIAEP